MPTPSPCLGSGTRVAAPVSSAFRDEKCPQCFHYSAPVKKHGEWYIRSHRKVVHDAYA